MSRSNLAYAEIEPTIFTVEEYLTFERGAKDKHEYYDGEIVKTAGASRIHNTITVNILVDLKNKLRGKNCGVYTGEMRTRIAKTRYVYPDIVAVCGEELYEDTKFDILLNPNVVVEVLSKSTAGLDKNEERQSYLGLDSLTDYVMVEQDRMYVEQYQRNGKMWNWLTYTKAEDKLILSSINCELLLSEIYADVQLPADLKLVED